MGRGKTSRKDESSKKKLRSHGATSVAKMREGKGSSLNLHRAFKYEFRRAPTRDLLRSVCVKVNDKDCSNIRWSEYALININCTMETLVRKIINTAHSIYENMGFSTIDANAIMLAAKVLGYSEEMFETSKMKHNKQQLALHIVSAGSKDSAPKDITRVNPGFYKEEIARLKESGVTAEGGFVHVEDGETNHMYDNLFRYLSMGTLTRLLRLENVQRARRSALQLMLGMFVFNVMCNIARQLTYITQTLKMYTVKSKHVDLLFKNMGIHHLGFDSLQPVGKIARKSKAERNAADAELKRAYERAKPLMSKSDKEVLDKAFPEGGSSPSQKHDTSDSKKRKKAKHSDSE